MKSMVMAAAMIAAGMLVGAGEAGATTNTIQADGSWQSFFFDGVVGSSFLDDYASNNPSTLSFSVELAGPAWLRVTDAGSPGDRFSISVDGVHLGNTSMPTGSSSAFTVNFDEAIASNAWSHGSWLLPAGTHLITGSVLAAPIGPGFGGLQVAAVPEPETWAMMVAGLGLVVAAAKRRRAGGR
jgi:hypothetical protein